MRVIATLVLFFTLFFGSSAMLCAAEESPATVASSTSFPSASGDAAFKYDLKNLSNFASAFKFEHWSELLIPGSPERGRVLFQWVMYLIVFPLFGILLIWGILQSLANDGFVDYVDILKRILTFVLFTGFSSLIFGYLLGLQQGMSSLLNIALNADIGVISKFMHMEDASTQTRLSLAMEEAIEKARADILNTGSERIAYTNYQKRDVSAPRCAYMLFPLVAYNESLALQTKSSAYVPYDDDNDEIDDVQTVITADLKACGKDARSLLKDFGAGYATILNKFSRYPGATWYSDLSRSKRANIEKDLKKLYGNNISINNTDEKLNDIDKSAPSPEIVWDLLGGVSEGAIQFFKANIDLFIKNPLVQHDINLAIWRAYHKGSDADVKHLTMQELANKMGELRKAEDGKVLAISDTELATLKEDMYNVILERFKSTCMLKPVVTSDKSLTPSEWNEKIASRWSVKEVLAAVAGVVASVVTAPLKLLAYLIDGFAQGLQRIIMWVLVSVMSFILALHFFFTCMSSAFVANKKTEAAFYKNIKGSLTLALVPFVCSLFLSVFNIMMNAFFTSTSTSAGAIVAGPFSGPIILIFLGVVQMVGLIFLAIYSMKAAGKLLDGGGIAGSALSALAAGAVATGVLAAKGAGMALGGPMGSALAQGASGVGKGIAGATDSLSGVEDGGQGESPGKGAVENVDKASNIKPPKPANVSDDKRSSSGNGGAGSDTSGGGSDASRSGSNVSGGGSDVSGGGKTSTGDTDAGGKGTSPLQPSISDNSGNNNGASGQSEEVGTKLDNAKATSNGIISKFCGDSSRYTNLAKNIGKEVYNWLPSPKLLDKALKKTYNTYTGSKNK